MAERALNDIWQREKLKTNGIKREKIEGLYLSETYSVEETQKLLVEKTKPQWSHDEVFGTYCNVNEYIDCPVDAAFDYAANIYSLEEWTYSMRDMIHLGNGLYKCREALAPNTVIYARTEVNSAARTVDYLCAWDQGEELWMRYYCRFIDAMPTLGKPGTILMWLNCKHPNYERGRANAPKHIQEGQARQDRPWVGDFWQFFGPGHQLEAKNLKIILEHRFGNKR